VVEQNELVELDPAVEVDVPLLGIAALRAALFVVKYMRALPALFMLVDSATMIALVLTLVPMAVGSAVSEVIKGIVYRQVYNVPSYMPPRSPADYYNVTITCVGKH